MLRSTDNTVGKYIHDDGSETTIKSGDSCITVSGSDGVTFAREDRNKYSVFLSGSSGCFMRCSFCHLTLNKAKYQPLEPAAVVDNAYAAVRAEAGFQPDLRSRYVKLCWMGMGDEQLIDPLATFETTANLAHNIIEDQLYAKGLDGCDIATTLPKIKDDGWVDTLTDLNKYLGRFERNPYLSNEPDRSAVRLFWSLQSGIQQTREMLIPNAMPLTQAATQLRKLQEQGINLIIHQMLFHGVNDSPVEIEALLTFLREEGLSNAELRILRYNSHPDASLSESFRFDQIVNELSTNVAKFKVQESKGSEIKAACGQFIKGSA